MAAADTGKLDKNTPEKTWQEVLGTAEVSAHAEVFARLCKSLEGSCTGGHTLNIHLRLQSRLRGPYIPVALDTGPEIVSFFLQYRILRQKGTGNFLFCSERSFVSFK